PAPAIEVEKVANGDENKGGNEHKHQAQEQLIGECARFYAAEIHERHGTDKEEHHAVARQPVQPSVNGFGHPYGIKEGLKEIIEKHRPAYQETQVGIEAASHVSVRGPRRRIDSRHATVAESCDHHGQHGNQYGVD